MTKMTKKRKIQKSLTKASKEPTFDVNLNELTKKDKNTFLSKAFRWYRTMPTKRLVNLVKKQIKGILNVPLTSIDRVSCILQRLEHQGVILDKETKERLSEKIEFMLSFVENSPVVSTKKKVNPAELTKKKISKHIAHIENEIDQFILNGFNSKFNVNSYLKPVKSRIEKKIREHFISVLSEITESMNRNSEFHEAYNFMTKPEKKKLIKFLEEIVGEKTTKNSQSKPKPVVNNTYSEIYIYYQQGNFHKIYYYTGKNIYVKENKVIGYDESKSWVRNIQPNKRTIIKNQIRKNSIPKNSPLYKNKTQKVKSRFNKNFEILKQI